MHIRDILLISAIIITLIILGMIFYKGKMSQKQENYQSQSLDSLLNTYGNLYQRYKKDGIKGVTKDEMYKLFDLMSEIRFGEYWDTNEEQHDYIIKVYRNVQDFVDEYWEKIYKAEGIEEKLSEQIKRKREAAGKSTVKAFDFGKSEADDDDDLDNLIQQINRLRIKTPRRTPSGSPQESSPDTSQTFQPGDLKRMTRM